MADTSVIVPLASHVTLVGPVSTPFTKARVAEICLMNPN
jgi:hypothetical protein